MPNTKAFLTPQEEQEIVAAIGIAEKNTSGEIRVHLEKTTSMAPIDRAVEVFHQLEMEKTKERNGVLIYLAYESKQFAICGDEGIDKKVPTDFWNSTKDTMRAQFTQGNFKQGLIDGILKAGEQLKTHFPYQEDDIDELSNEISKG
jgi:uncharacterized membrane protein